ncbi:MAG TPA: FxLYD domain-containing protein [Ardenticatenaceae bacterium]|nr:FxLYD domain-containing protein [Ardenticatenaceae bacterium]
MPTGFPRHCQRFLSACLILSALLAGCRTNPTVPTATGEATSAPDATVPVQATAPAEPTAPPTATVEPSATLEPSPTPVPPTPTPDLAQLPERYDHPQGLFNVHYPTGWTVEDLSDEDEVLVSFRGPADPGEAIFLVNLVNPGGELSEVQVPTLVDNYLNNFFGDQAGLVTLEREELPDGAVRVVALGPGASPAEQLHLEFRFTPMAPLFQALVMLSSEAAWPTTEPLFAGMAQSLQLDAAQAGVVPTPGAANTENPVEGLALVNTNAFTATTGSLYVVGEVQNATDQPYQDVEVTVHLLDPTGTVLATEAWPTQTSLVAPGATSPLLVIFDQPPTGWMDLRTEIRANPGGSAVESVYSDLTISQDVGDVPSFGDYRITGTVTNTGEGAGRYVRVVGTLYDADGKVLAVESAFVTSDVMEAGGAFPFEIVFFSKAPGDVARYSLTAFATRVVDEPQP